jgi:hypothetical protein
VYVAASGRLAQSRRLLQSDVDAIVYCYRASPRISKVAIAVLSGRNVFCTETKKIVIVTTLTSVKYWEVMSHLDHVGSAWSSLALIMAVLDTIHAITREVT